MILERRKKSGQSMIEFIAVIMFLLAAFLVFQKYITRAFIGRWKGVGDSLGQGRIYDPKKTVSCATNVFFENQPPVWYDYDCFERDCKEHCLEVTKSLDACRNCLENTCRSQYCDDPET